MSDNRRCLRWICRPWVPLDYGSSRRLRFTSIPAGLLAAALAKMRSTGEKGHGLEKCRGGTYKYAHSFKVLRRRTDLADRTVPGQVLRSPAVALAGIKSAQQVRHRSWWGRHPVLGHGLAQPRRCRTPLVPPRRRSTPPCCSAFT